MEPTLLTYFGLPGYIWLWVVTLILGGLFAYRMRYLVQLMRLGESENRFDRIPLRIKRVLIDVFAQPRFRDKLMRPTHLSIFWGFVFFAGTF